MLSLQHITKAIAVALAVGAFAAPVALAGPVAHYSRQDKQLTLSAQAAGVQGMPPILSAPNPAQSAAIQRAEAAQGLAPIVPSAARYSSAETNAYPTSSGVVRVAASDSGFDWGDAGIGAAGGLVLSVLAIGAGLVLVERRPRRTKTTAVATS